MTMKQELHRLIDLLEDEDEESALEYLQWLINDEDVLTDEERDAVKQGESEIARGEFVTLDQFARAVGDHN
jgi:hypothetical protein